MTCSKIYPIEPLKFSDFVRFIITVCFLLAITPSPAQQPNILLIITDQHTGSIMSQRDYPYVTTPGIDKIADEGVTFTRAYTPYPVCTAMRMSLLTGLMPSSINDPTDYKSIGERMADAGYEVDYHGKWHVGSTSIYADKAWHGFPGQTGDGGSNDTSTKGRLIDFIRQDHSKPFFLVASFMNPHDACELARHISGIDGIEDYKDEPVDWQNIDVENDAPPLPDNFDIMENEPEGFYSRRERASSPEGDYWGKHPTLYWTETEWRQYLWGYDRLVEMVDAHINDVVGELETRGLQENTVIIYSSDHGDGHASHQWNQKMTFYEESINVPFIISWKGKTRAGILDESTLITNTLDINSTILKLAGVEPPAGFLGKDLRPVILQDPGAETFIPRDYVVSEMNQGNLTGRMVVGSEYKYFLFDGGEYPETLLDVVNDPGEMTPVNQDGRYRDQLIEARQNLKDWVEQTDDPFDISTMPTDLPDPVTINENAQKGLFSFSVRGQGLVFTSDMMADKVVIVDMKGRTVADLPVKNSRVHWNGLTKNNQGALPGVYMVTPFNQKVIILNN